MLLLILRHVHVHRVNQSRINTRNDQSQDQDELEESFGIGPGAFYHSEELRTGPWEWWSLFGACHGHWTLMLVLLVRVDGARQSKRRHVHVRP